MTGLEFVVALEILKRGVSAFNDLSDEVPEFIDNVKELVGDDDDEAVIVEKVEKASKRVHRKRRPKGK